MRIVRWSAVLASIAIIAAASAAEPPGDGDLNPLIGYWSMEQEFPAPLFGMLTVTREGDTWHAAIGKVKARYSGPADALRFVFDSYRSSFRGKLAEDGKTIEGFWLRPPGETADRQDPGGSGQAFATRMQLRQSESGQWTGEVQPLDDRFTLYLKIFRDAESGFVLAAFRNPQLNSRGDASRYRVTRAGDVLRFWIPKDDGGFEVLKQAEFLSTPDRLEIFWPDLGREVALMRRRPEEIPHFFPRPPNSAAYIYKAPPETDDGWQPAPAREVGIDESALQELVRKIAASDPAERRPSLMHSLLVARKGKLVLEEYFFGYDREPTHDTRSAAKTFSSVMLGAAMKDGIAISPDTKIYQLLAKRGPFANPDPRKAQITLAHLMTHSAGFACNDNDDASPGNENTMQAQGAQPDWWKYTLDLPMAHEPGKRYAYCSANINLMGAALTEATGTWLPEYFDRTVAQPLDFGTYHWNLMPTEEGYLGGGAFLRSRDFLKVGQAYLDGGVWRGRRIVDAAWVERSTARMMPITPETTGYSAEEFGEYYGAGVDGYAWHSFDTKIGDREVKGYQATGNGGQVMIVVPEYELVVVFTGGNYMQGGIWGQWGSTVIGGVIIPAIRD